MLMKAVFLEKSDLSSRKQRVHLLILCSLGILALVLMVILVLPFLCPAMPRWDRAHYAAGKVNPKPGLFTKQGLHLTRTSMGSMGDNILSLRIGSNVWFLEVMAPVH
jgi:hypothetical protein